MNSRAKVFQIILVNILPCIGVLFLNWSVTEILFSYWLENVAIGFYQILKMRRSTMNYPVNAESKLVPGPLRPATSAERVILPIFFLLHYGVFSIGHLIFIGVIGNMIGQGLKFSWLIPVSAIPFFINYRREYRDVFIANKEYESVPLAKQMFSPYRRVITMHLTILFGGIILTFFAGLWPKMAVVIVVLKAFFDYKSKQKKGKIWGEFTKEKT